MVIHTIAPGGFSIDIYKQRIDELSKDSLRVNKFDEREISGTIELATDKMMYLPLPVDGGWSLKVNGEQASTIKLLGGMTGIMLKKGHNEILMSYHQRYLGAALFMVIAGCIIYVLTALIGMKRKKICPQD